MQTITSLKIRFFHLPSLNGKTRSWRRKTESLSLFKTNILKFIRRSTNSVYNCHNPKGLKFITRLRLGLSREHKFKHSFQDRINPLCSCRIDIGSTEHFLLHCPQFVNERRTLQSTIGNINYKLQIWIVVNFQEITWIWKARHTNFT